jgi:chromate reductase, NAD(P)H dehydrogenase (quinone)
MKIIAFGASYSKNSINKQFAAYAANQFNNAEIEVLDLNNYSVPLFTVDAETESGHPEAAKLFLEKLNEADLLIISMAEHNGSYTAAFKNLFDWTSRVKLKMFENKKMLLLSTAPGVRGGLGVIESAKSRFPIHGADIIDTFSLPHFKDNFNSENGIVNDELNTKFEAMILTAQNKLMLV